MDIALVSGGYYYFLVVENTFYKNRNKEKTSRFQKYLSYIFESNKDIVERQLLLTNVKATHTSEEIERMAEYYNAVDEGIVEYVKKARSQQYIWPLEILTISEKISVDIEKITGINTLGNKVVLDKSTIAHIDKRHGVKGITDQSMSDDRTLSRIGYVLNNYDGVIGGKGSKAVRLANGKYAPTVIFYKKINGIYYVVEAVTDAKSKTNRIISAYISERKPEQ